MNIKDYTYLLNNPEIISETQTLALEKVVKAFPYFQSARVLYLKGLKNQQSYKYNQELKITAAHTSDRSILFDVITSSKYIQQENNIKSLHQNPTPLITSTEKTTKTLETSATPTEILNIGKPLEFTTTEAHSFNEWLQLNSNLKTIKRDETQNDEKKAKNNIIDKFIAANPKIKPVKNTPNTIMAKEEMLSNDQIMTETLAKVYLEQKKYEYAIKAYRILSLKYPEKSSFFADQIKAIKNLEKK